MKSLRKYPNYILTYIELNGTEYSAKVWYDIQPPEPDVGIFQHSVDIESVCIKEYDPVAIAKRRILREAATYSVNVTDLVQDQMDRLLQEVIEQLDANGEY